MIQNVNLICIRLHTGFASVFPDLVIRLDCILQNAVGHR